MTTSTILPGISATVSASTKEKTVSQSIDANQEKESEQLLENDSGTEELSVAQEDSKSLDNDIVYESSDADNDDNYIEKSAKESDDIDSGLIGNATWRIDSSGTLHISGGDMGIGSVAAKWTQYASEIKKIIFEGKLVAAKNLTELFRGLDQVTEIDNLSNLDTSSVTNMRSMFNGMSSLTTLDLSTFDTSSVTDMSSMFIKMSSLTTLDLSSFNTSKVTNMYGMFLGPSLLTELDLSNFDTSNVSYMHNMFANQSSLSTLDVSSFQTPKLITSSAMFLGVSALEKLDLSGFETSNETIMSGMFNRMDNLSQVKLGGSFTFAEGSAFPGPGKSTEYTGNWINVATGTLDSPLGVNIWSPAEMMANYNPKTDADTYVWQRVVTAEDVTVRYVDSQGEEIHSPQNISGNVGDDYDASTSAYKLIIDGYTLDESKLPENATGKLGEQAQIVTYVYNKNKAVGSVTLRYVDTFGQPIEDFMFGNDVSSMTFKGEVGNSADDDLAYLDVPGWVLISKLPTGVVYSETPQTFDIVYDNAGTIYVNYEDTNGVKLKPEWRNTDYLSQFDWTTGQFPSSVAYEVSPLDIPGYEMIRVEGDAAKGDIEGHEIKHVTFVYSKPTMINIHDSNIYVGDKWSAEDNFDSAFDKDGKSVDFKDIKITGDVDTSKAGTYEVTYSYDGIESKATVTVKDKQTAVNVHDSIVYVGDEWTAENNFDSAFDKDGKPVDFEDITVTGDVDTTKAGTYEVTYSIPEEHWGRGLVEGYHTATAKIVVSEEENKDNNDSGSKGEESNSDKDNLSSTDELSGENNTQNTKGLPTTGEHTSALIFMIGIALLLLGSIFGVLRIKKNKK
ncbi:bacterial Ig-like domain-containing protein [Lactococcus garvieae]|uniref:bacterial Ig-like domain-containing protein n=1 Tax=Lactococcus garvieae TaxID=1363 RepID=UPI00385443AE